MQLVPLLMNFIHRRTAMLLGGLLLLGGLVAIEGVQLIELGRWAWRQRVLNDAARAGLCAAMLPQATVAEVERAVRRRLHGTLVADDVAAVHLAINSKPELTSPLADVQRGDLISVSLGCWSTPSVLVQQLPCGKLPMPRYLIAVAQAEKP